MKALVYLFAPVLLAACVSRAAPPTEQIVSTEAVAPLDCSAETFSIYFEEGAMALSKESDAVIDAVAKSQARCDLYKMEIKGYADASGDSEANKAISAARVEAVKAALEARGVDAERVRLVAYGEMGSVTDEGKDEPLNRKAEVRLFSEK